MCVCVYTNRWSGVALAFSIHSSMNYTCLSLGGWTEAFPSMHYAGDGVQYALNRLPVLYIMVQCKCVMLLKHVRFFSPHCCYSSAPAKCSQRAKSYSKILV